MKNILIISLIFCVLACKQEYVKEPIELPKVKTAKVVQLEAVNEPIPICASGKLQSSEDLKLSFKTGGYIRYIAVNPGERVKKGQVLALLNTEEIDAQVVQAESEVAKLRRDLGRFSRLYQDSAATLQSVQDLETGLSIAESGLVMAKFNQTHSKIIAPATGKVLMKLAEENELVNPGQPVIVLGTQQKGMILRVGLSDMDVVKLKLGDSAVVSLDAYDELEARAVVTEIAAEGDPITGTFGVELTIDPYPYDLKSGFFARAVLYPSTQVAYFRVPLQAIVGVQDEQVQVLVPDEDRALDTLLRPASIGNEHFTVAASRSGERLSVIAEGAAYLQSGEIFETKSSGR